MSYSNKQFLQEITKKINEELMSSKFLYDKKEYCVENYDNAYVLPSKKNKDGNPWCYGGVVDENKQFIKLSGQYAYGENDRVRDGYDFDEEDVEYIDEDVLYLNYFIPQWGHYLLDVIGRLWYILKDSNKKIVYSCRLNEDFRIKGNLLQLLEMLGINKDRIIFLNKVTKFKSITIADTSICVSKYYTKEYKNLIDKLVNVALKDYKLKTERKIFCSRKHFKSIKNKEFGEELIEDVFKDNGYEIIYMEEHNLIDQIRLLNECKEVVCVSGTLVHNAMFIRNNKCKFTIINKTYKVNPIVYLTNEISNAEFTFVDAYLSPLEISIGKGPFLLAITDEFIEYCKYKNLQINNIDRKISLKILIQYYYKYLRQYKNKIIHGQKISNSGLKQYDLPKSVIRKTYLKNIGKIGIKIL